MNAFTVTWHQSAEDKLTEYWLASHDRKAVQTAADAIDRELASRPTRVGPIEGSRQRIITVAPLIVMYFVREQDRVVEITDVQLLPPPE
jgi:predicted dinucleotide-binding enzyme